MSFLLPFSSRWKTCTPLEPPRHRRRPLVSLPQVCRTEMVVRWTRRRFDPERNRVYTLDCAAPTAFTAWFALSAWHIRSLSFSPLRWFDNPVRVLQNFQHPPSFRDAVSLGPFQQEPSTRHRTIILFIRHHQKLPGIYPRVVNPRTARRRGWWEPRERDTWRR